MEIEEMDFEDEALPTVVVTDESGRSLSCYVEHSLQLKDKSYVVLFPVDTPVYLFAWSDDEEEEPEIIEEEEDIEVLYPIAKAVLEEQNMVLHWTAFTLTVSGDIPEEEDEEYGYEPDDVNGTSHEAFQFLAEFYHEDQEYAVCMPLEPVLILARMENGKAYVLEEEELIQIQPILEEYLDSQAHRAIEEDEEEDFSEE